MDPAEHPYSVLRARLDRTTSEIAARRSADLSCKLGCTACCQVQLSVSPLEAERVRAALSALDAPARARVRQRAAKSDADASGPCAMLDENGACAIYDDRPLVCRTQGNALLYPPHSLPSETVFATTDAGDITWCPLNYTQVPPRSEDVLACERIDELLALAAFEATGEPRQVLERVALRDLARE